MDHRTIISIAGELCQIAVLVRKLLKASLPNPISDIIIQFIEISMNDLDTFFTVIKEGTCQGWFSSNGKIYHVSFLFDISFTKLLMETTLEEYSQKAEKRYLTKQS